MEERQTHHSCHSRQACPCPCPIGMPKPMPNRQAMPHASPIFLNRWLVGAHKRDRPRCGKKVPQMILQIFVTSNTTKRCHVHNLANMDSFPHMLQTKVFRSHLNIGDQVILLGLLTYNDDCLNISNDRKNTLSRPSSGHGVVI